MHIAHHPIFVALSSLTALLGAWTALDLFRRVRAHAGAWRLGWLAATALAMGLSIWSMHFIAMLGFNPGGEVRYDVGRTALSLLLAIATTAFAFFSARGQGIRREIIGGVVMGAGICTMHYVGMSAVITGVSFANEPTYVLLAFLVAVTASTGALVVARRETTAVQRVLGAVVLGFAIVGMHYTAMYGIRIVPGPVSDVGSGGMDSLVLAVAVATGTLFILLLSLIAAVSDRRFEAIAVREASRSEQQLRAILDNLPIGVFVAASPSGEIRFANREAVRLLGGPLEGDALWAHGGAHGPIDAAGQRLPPSDHVLYRAMHEHRRVGPELRAYRHPDGASMQLEVTAAPIQDGVSGGALAVSAFQDVTAKLLAEEQARQAVTLRESEERFRLIAEHAPVMLWMSDANARYVYLNKMLRDFHGVDDATAADWTRSLLPQDRMKFAQQFEHARRTSQGFSMEATFELADGAQRIVHILACPRFSVRRELLGLIGVNTDVTEARQAQRDLQQINELLEQRVAAALAQKAEAEAALMHAQRLEALGRLTGGVAHDFNNLLTVVIGALDVILRHPDNVARRVRLGEAALSAARRGERLTAQLLAFARRQPLQPEMRDLNELIRECEPLLRRAAGEGLVFKLRLCQEKGVVRIDPAQFEATLLNLVVNAIDASPAGGEIAVETQLRNVSHGEVPNVTPGEYFCMSVADHGQGMSSDVISRIFEPFFTTKALGKGTGLGLSQVYGFVKQSGGEIQVYSAQGAGTCFRIYLPISAAQTERAQARDLAKTGTDRSLTVLLTEDDPAVAAVTEAMLIDLGHKVHRAANADEALQILWSDVQLDVLFSDVVMPGGMTGVDLAQQAATLRPQLKVLLTSGFAGESLDEALSHGAWPFLRKPFFSGELAAAFADLTAEPQQERRQVT